MLFFNKRAVMKPFIMQASANLLFIQKRIALSEVSYFFTIITYNIDLYRKVQIIY